MVSGWKVRVGLVDDHPLFRRGLAAVLNAEPDLEVVGEAGGADEVRRLVRTSDIDLAIVDVLLPATSGLTIAHEIRDIAPRCRILALSVIDEPCLIADMFRAGAHGFALKTQSTSSIVEAIRLVTGGIRYLPPTVSRDAIEAQLATSPAAPPTNRLTKREREIFELIIRGYTNSDIGKRLFIALRTVETHRQRIMKKLTPRSMMELQRIAARHGGI